jgi:anti-sigma regulatory factor (Ser/Thr protein kinase)
VNTRDNTREQAGLAIGFTADGLYALRAALAAHGLRLGLDGTRLGQLLVVATELVTNVIRHSDGHGQIRLWRTGESVYCEVIDNGPGIKDPERAGREPVPLAGDSGRGLWIVRQLTDECTIAPRDPGTSVTVVFSI